MEGLPSEEPSKADFEAVLAQKLLLITWQNVG
jgi:hypothetical protein